MAITYNKSGQPTQGSSIGTSNYDYVQAYAASRVSDPSIIGELVTAYIAIAATLGITPTQFIELVQSQGSSQAQDIFLAAYLNSTRVRNSLIGVNNNKNTPLFISREINP
jgi:hypothetical protein